MVAARRVFAKLSRLSRAVRPGGRQRRGSTRRGAQRARFPLPRHTRPRQAIQMFYGYLYLRWYQVMVDCPNCFPAHFLRPQRHCYFFWGVDPPKIIAISNVTILATSLNPLPLLLPTFL